MEVAIDRPSAGRVVLRPTGKVDAESASDLRAQLQAITLENPEIVIVDLSEVDFLDSSGLSALVSGLKGIRISGGELRLSGPRSQPLTALRLTMLHRVFPIFDDVTAALRGG